MVVRFLVGLVCAAGLAACGAELSGGDHGTTDSAIETTKHDAAIDSPPPVDAHPCTGGDAHVQDPSGGCLVLFTTPKLRADAEAACVGIGGHLASIKTAASSLVISGLVANTASAFVGGTDVVTEGTFLWPDGSPLTYTNWRTGEPNNGGGQYEEDCIVIQGLLGGLWDDRPCAPPPVGSGSYAYVCSY